MVPIFQVSSLLKRREPLRDWGAQYKENGIYFSEGERGGGGGGRGGEGEMVMRGGGNEEEGK